jgi:hypothetical protein
MDGSVFGYNHNGYRKALLNLDGLARGTSHGVVVNDAVVESTDRSSPPRTTPRRVSIRSGSDTGNYGWLTNRD